MIIRSTILLSISAVAKAFCDAIRFHPSQFPFQTDWWLAKGEFAWNNRTWLETYFFSFISDGWHCFDSVRIASMILLVALLLTEIWKKKIYNEYEENRIDNNAWLLVTMLVVGGYIYHGIIFEIAFNIL